MSCFADCHTDDVEPAAVILLMVVVVLMVVFSLAVAFVTIDVETINHALVANMYPACKASSLIASVISPEVPLLTIL